MVYDKVIEGKYVNLRSVDTEYAAFTLSLRQDPELTKYLPKLDITVDQQRNWITKQREKEGDYFFVIMDKGNNRIGVIGIYDIKNGQGETGRIAIKGNSFQSIEAQLLSFDFAFDELGLEKTVNYVYSDNVHATRFSQLFGSIETGRYKDNSGMIRIDGIITKDSFKSARKKIERMLYR